MIESYDHKAQDRFLLRQKLAPFSGNLEETDHTSWWRVAIKEIIAVESALPELHDQQMAIYLREQIDMAKQILKTASMGRVINPNDIGLIANMAIMQLSRNMAERFKPENVEVSHNFIPIEDLVSMHPESMRLSYGKIKEVDVKILGIKNPLTEVWSDIPLVVNDCNSHFWHKGGSARAAMDVYASAPLTMLASELPQSDFDGILAGDETIGHKRAIAIGVDPDGIEHLGNGHLDFVEFANGRDTDQNQCCLGADGLHFSDEAFLAAKTGKIKLKGEYVPNKAIYNTDRMIWEGLDLAKPRGLSRMAKNIVEGKALSFDYLPINSNLDMSIYVLFLARKWSKRENFGELMDKFFYILREMHQTRNGEHNIMQVLTRAHEENPFFDFRKEINTDFDVAIWKAKKVAKQIDREVTWLFSLPGELEMVRTKNDTIPIEISLKDYQNKTSAYQIDKKQWVYFVDKCNARSDEYTLNEKSPMRRIFMTDGEDDAISCARPC